MARSRSECHKGARNGKSLEMIAPGMLSCITAMPAGSAFCSVDGTAWILSNGFFRVYWKFGRLAFGALSRCTAVCSSGRRGGLLRPPLEDDTLWGRNEILRDLEQCDGTGMRHLRERPAVRQ